MDPFRPRVPQDPREMTSGDAPAATVPTADGAGGIAWEEIPEPDPSNGGGGNGGTIDGLITLDAGTVTYDDSGPDVETTIATKWGLDGSGPYFDDTGAVEGEEAALRIDPTTGEFVVSALNLQG